MRIQAGVAVVAEHQQAVLRHRHRSEAVGDRLGTPGFGHGLTVPPELTVANGDLITGLPDHALDQGGVRVVSGLHQGRRCVKHDDAAVRQRALQPGTQLLHQDPVLQLQTGQHRAGGDPARFQHGPAQHEGQGQPDQHLRPAPAARRRGRLSLLGCALGGFAHDLWTGQHDRCILNHPPHPVLPPSASGCSAEANLRAALLLLRQLQACGLRRLVLCPGSRSAPLAVAAGLLAGPGLDLITAIDERSAAFLAIGLGRVDGRPAAVVTTSGTAVANLLPAVVEADSGAVPLLLLTADRPQRLKHRGANQTVNQQAFLVPACRRLFEADGRGLAAMPAGAVTALARAAWEACLEVPVGPVHLNLPLEEPLHVAAAALAAVAQALPEPQQPLHAGPAASPVETAPHPVSATALACLDPDQPGVVVVGPWRGTAAALYGFAEALRRWQQRTGWPVLADGLSGLRGLADLELIQGYDLLLADGHGLAPAPQLLRLGPMPASRRLQQWISSCEGPQLLITEADPRNLDGGHPATARLGSGLAAWLAAQPAQRLPGAPAPASERLRARWRGLEAELQRQLDQELPGIGAPTVQEPGLARALSRALPEGLPLMLASSSPVRDWESFAAADAPHRLVHGFRGASGIDGTLSLAAGLACAAGRLVLLTGDLALLHDANGWLWREQLRARGARLCVVVVDNGGGGIFEQLPIRLPDPAAPLDFERLFAMPQAIDHVALAAGYGVPARRLSALDDLDAGLHWALEQPLALLELRSDRRADAGLRQRLRRRMARLSVQP